MITIREPSTKRFNYFREISRVDEVMCRQKKLGKNCKFARCIMRAGNAVNVVWIRIFFSPFSFFLRREYVKESKIVFVCERMKISNDETIGMRRIAW